MSHSSLWKRTLSTENVESTGINRGGTCSRTGRCKGGGAGGILVSSVFLLLLLFFFILFYAIYKQVKKFFSLFHKEGIFGCHTASRRSCKITWLTVLFRGSSKGDKTEQTRTVLCAWIEFDYHCYKRTIRISWAQLEKVFVSSISLNTDNKRTMKHSVCNDSQLS